MCGVWSPGRGCLGRVGLGGPGGLPRGRLGGRSCLVGCVLAGVVGLSGAGMRDAPAVLLLPACVGSEVWWVSLRGVGVACCRGSGVVRPGRLACVLLPCVGGGVWVWVGWL